MSRYFSKSIRDFVASRASYRCEYCQKPEIVSNFPFHIEHIISLQHKGSNNLNNLAYACSRCNWKKGTNIATVLEEDGDLIALFHPRKEIWTSHFQVDNGLIVAKTDCAKGTIQLLQMNTVELILERQALMEAGLF
ncbi:MAG: HNH endonuclease signature motif containing protein [Bacteroidota bacterium]